MNARELVTKLQALIDGGHIDPDVDVQTEGCDCYGIAADVEAGPDRGPAHRRRERSAERCERLSREADDD